MGQHTSQLINATPQVRRFLVKNNIKFIVLNATRSVKIVAKLAASICYSQARVTLKSFCIH